MKHYSKLLYLVCCFFLFHSVKAFAYTPSSSTVLSKSKVEATSENKHYVNPRLVRVTSKGILIIKDGKTLRVNELYSDEKGPYVILENILEKGKPAQTEEVKLWTCSRCDHVNKKRYSRCESCGKSQKDSKR